MAPPPDLLLRQPEELQVPGLDAVSRVIVRPGAASLALTPRDPAVGVDEPLGLGLLTPFEEARVLVGRRARQDGLPVDTRGDRPGGYRRCRGNRWA